MTYRVTWPNGEPLSTLRGPVEGRVRFRMPWTTVQAHMNLFLGGRGAQSAKLVRISRVDKGCAYAAPGLFEVNTQSGMLLHVTLA